MPPVLACLVEGHGDVAAVPVLIRRTDPLVHVPRPIRVKRQKIVQQGELERYLQIAEANIVDGGGVGGILLVLDADQDCAAQLGPQLLDRMCNAIPDRPAAVVVAVREFESWLVAGLAETDNFPDESRPSKGWLAARDGRYVETIDQPRLSATFDMARAFQRSRSYRHWCTSMDRLRTALAAEGPASA